MEPGARIAVKIEEPNRIPEDVEEIETSKPARKRQIGQNSSRVSAPANLTLTAGSRRVFLKAGIASLGAMALWLMDRLARRSESIPENSETTITVPWSAAQGVHFEDRMIVVNSPREISVFSSTCPHLGCRINRTEGAELACPCHGSRFDLQGNAVHGPATRRLHNLPFALERAKGILRVTLESRHT